jgi:hypothetical protein
MAAPCCINQPALSLLRRFDSAAGPAFGVELWNNAKLAFRERRVTDSRFLSRLNLAD